MIIVMPITNGGFNIGAKSLLSMKYINVETLRKEAVNLTMVSPEVRVNVEVICGNKNTSTTIHGVSEEYFMIRKLGIESGLFSCINSLPVSLNEISPASHGTGLKNLSERLRLLYPERHELKINKTESSFEVRLMIQLKS